MNYPFRNFVFEGGGVRGTAYAGALKVFEEEGIIPDIVRVGGSSAGAINAVAFSVGYTPDESAKILTELDFKALMDGGRLSSIYRLLTRYGLYKGDACHQWLRDLVGGKTGKADATFAELRQMGCRDLHLLGTNLSTRFTEIFSAERTPDVPVADAARISMSFPLFFAAKRHGPRGDLYVDGGMLNNYPVKLFDRERFISNDKVELHSRNPDYYETLNKAEGFSGGNRYVYNRETLGFRLNPGEKIAVFRDGAEPESHRINNIFDYAYGLFESFLYFQDNQHLHSDDWHRTVYLDTLDVDILDFDLSEAKVKGLIESGEKCARDYLRWYNDTEKDPARNNPATPRDL